MAVGGGGAFTWTTNISEVARQVEQGLRRVQQATRSAGKGGANQADFLTGFERRVEGVAQTFQRRMTAAGEGFHRTMEREAARGQRLSGRDPEGRTIQQAMRPAMDRAMRELETLGRAVATSLPEHLAPLRQQLTGALQGIGRGIVQDYRTNVESLSTELNRIRTTQGLTMQRGRHFAVSEAAGGRALDERVSRIGAVPAQPLPPEEVKSLRNSMDALARTGREQVQSQRQVTQSAALQGRELAQQWARELASNPRTDPRRFDPHGARRLTGVPGVPRGEVFFGAQGQAMQRQFLPVGPEGGMRQVGLRMFDPREELQPQDLAILEEKQRQLARSAAKARETEERKSDRTLERERQMQLRRRLDDEFKMGRLQRAGPIVRRRDSGDIFRLMGDDRARPVRGAMALAQAEERLNREREKQIRAAQRERRERDAFRGAAVGGAAGGGGGPMDRFFRMAAEGPGGRGRGLRGTDLMQNVFNYSRYFVASAAILTVVRALTAAKAAAVDYRESLTDLEVALGDGARVQARFITGLSDIARFAGANTGAAIDSAVRGIRAFAPPPDLDENIVESWTSRIFSIERPHSDFQQRAQRVGTEVARVAQQVAVIAEKELRDATGDVISIASAFDLAGGDEGIESFGRIVDTIAVAKRQLAGDSKEIAQGLSSVGAVAAEAGFTLEETGNLISLVQARTDQTGRAVAQRLGRIFSIMGGREGRNAIERLNAQLAPELRVDTTGSVRDQLMQIASIYAELTAQQQNMIRNALGGVANTRELVPILQNPDLIQQALDAQFEGVGAGAEEFRRKATDLAGSLRRLRGDILGVTTAIFEAGIGDAFLLATQGTITLTNAVRQLLNIYNRLMDTMNNVNVAGRGMGDWLQTVIFLTLASRGAITMWGKAASAGLLPAAFGVGSGQRQPGVLGRTSRMLGQPMRATGVGAAIGIGAMQGRFWDAGGAAGITTRALRGMTAQIGALGARARNFINANPFLIIAGGLLAIFAASDRARQYIDTLTDSIEVMGASAPRGAQHLRDFAFDLRQQADELRRAAPMIDRIFGGGEAARRADAMDARARRVFDFQKELAEAQRAMALARTDPVEAIRTDTAESVRESLQLLEDQGRSAETRMYALAGAIQNLAEQSEQTIRRLNELERLEFGFELADEVLTGLSQQIEDEILRSRVGENFWRDTAKLLFAPRAGGSAQRDVLRDLQEQLGGNLGDQIQDSIRAAVEAQGGELGPGVEMDLAETVWNMIERQFDGMDELDENQVRNLRSRVMDAVIQNARGWAELIEDPMAPIAMAVDMIQLAQQGTQEQMRRAQLQGIGEPTLDAAQERVRLLEQARADFVRMFAGMEDQAFFARGLEQLDVAIIEAQLDEVQARRDQIRSLAELRASQLAPSLDLERLRVEIDALRQERAVVRDPEELRRIDAQLNEAEFRMAQIQLERVNAQRSAQIDSRDTVGRAFEAAAAAQREINLLVSQGDQASAEYWRAREAYAEALIQARQEEIQLVRAQAMARLDPRDSLGRAQAELDSAIRNFRLQLPGTRGFAEAIEEIRRQSHEVAEIQRRVRAAGRLAAVDPRDTRGEIVANLQNTVEELRAAGPDAERRLQAQRQVRELSIRLADYDREVANERTLASADSRSSLQQAQANLDVALRNVRAARHDELAFIRAQREVQQARIALVEAQIEAASLARQLNIDLTDPVATALEEARTAQERLRAARRTGAAPDVLASMEIDARNAEARAEAAAFQQRLSDITVARDLGRISHVAYMAYLNEEAARLRAIHDRTRQQQEQLDQVELALKAARDQMEAQFNIGDIRMPTPFEVRRAIAARDAGLDPATVAGGFAVPVNMSTSISNVITVNGADIQEVKQLLTQLLGPNAIGQVTPSTSGARRL